MTERMCCGTFFGFACVYLCSRQRNRNYGKMPEKIPYVLVLLFYSIISAENFSPPPVLPDQAPALSIWALTSNDGFGHNYGVDEDNLRTFGLNLGALYKDRYLTMLDLSVLTDRNLTDSLSRRIDERTCRKLADVLFYITGRLIDAGVIEM